MVSPKEILIIVFYSMSLTFILCIAVLKVKNWIKQTNKKNKMILRFRSFRIEPEPELEIEIEIEQELELELEIELELEPELEPELEIEVEVEVELEPEPELKQEQIKPVEEV